MSRLIDADEAMKVTIKLLVDTLYNANPEEYHTAVRLQVLNDTVRKIVLKKFYDIQTAYDVDKVVELAKQKAVELMSKQFSEDECHMFSKGVQAMYLAYTENVKGGGIDGKVD